jgi:multiple sugar transport system permease protein
MANVSATRPLIRPLPGAARTRQLGVRILSYVLLTLFGLFFAFPLFWLLSSSLQTWQELQSYLPHLLPDVPQWYNYVRVFELTPFHRWMLNSLIIIGITVPGTILTATMCAYAFARFEFPGRDIWFYILLGTVMIPSQITLIPQYIMFFKLKMVNTYVPLTIGAWLGGGAFNIFMLRQFIMSIPRDLDEAAIVDGANPFDVLFKILMPLMKPALTTVALLGFLSQWNSFLIPFIYLNSTKLFTAAVGLRYFMVLPMTTREPKDHLLNAAAAIMTVPVLAIFVAGQRYFVSGIVMTGLKL